MVMTPRILMVIAALSAATAAAGIVSILGDKPQPTRVRIPDAEQKVGFVTPFGNITSESLERMRATNEELRDMEEQGLIQPWRADGMVQNRLRPNPETREPGKR